MLTQQKFKFFLLTGFIISYHWSYPVLASDKGSLQAQIPEYNLNELDQKIKDKCNAEAVQASGFDPNSPNNPTKADYQKQQFDAMAQGMAEEYILHNHQNLYRTREREREWNMRDSLKAQSDRAQGYVKAYRTCLQNNVPGQ